MLSRNKESRKSVPYLPLYETAHTTKATTTATTHHSKLSDFKIWLPNPSMPKYIVHSRKLRIGAKIYRPEAAVQFWPVVEEPVMICFWRGSIERTARVHTSRNNQQWSPRKNAPFAKKCKGGRKFYHQYDNHCTFYCS